MIIIMIMEETDPIIFLIIRFSYPRLSSIKLTNIYEVFYKITNGQSHSRRTPCTRALVAAKGVYQVHETQPVDKSLRVELALASSPKKLTFINKFLKNRGLNSQ
jgi:hypothetical protein